MAELSSTGLTFAYRGNTLTAYYADGMGEGFKVGSQSSTVQILSITGAFPSSGVGMSIKNLNLDQSLQFSSRGSYPEGSICSYLSRWVMPWSGVPAQNWFMMKAGSDEVRSNARMEILVQNTGAARVRMWDEFGTSRISFVAGFFSMTANTPYESMVTMNWNSKICRVSVRDDTAVLFDTQGTMSLTLSGSIMGKTANHFALNQCVDNTTNLNYIIETLFWDTEQSHDYTLRTDYWSTPSKDVSSNTSPGISKVESGTSWILDGNTLTGTLAVLTSTDPGIANVLSGTGYTIDNSSLTGTYHDASYSDPGVANVLSGTSYIFNDSTLAGTYHDGSYSDPGIANVLLDTNYIFNDSTLTGTLSVPQSATGAAGTFDLNNLKEQIRFILTEANTTGSSSVDLSGGLPSSYRVRNITKYNPERIKWTGDMLPAVTIWVDSKGIEPKTFAKNQLNTKREGEISVNIACAVYNDSFADLNEDPADDEAEIIMENIERILRAHETLGGSVNWQYPNNTSYHTLPIDEEVHYRVAVMSLRCKVLY